MSKEEIIALMESGEAELHGMDTGQIEDTQFSREQARERISDAEELLHVYRYA